MIRHPPTSTLMPYTTLFRSASDDHTVTFANVTPSITVDKTGPASVDEGGASTTYTFKITNTSVSTDPHTGTSVSDRALIALLPSAVAANGGNPIVLAPGASF